MQNLLYSLPYTYLKMLAHNLGNFKNVPKTMAGRHQRLMCYYLANRSQFSNFNQVDAITVGKGMCM